MVIVVDRKTKKELYRYMGYTIEQSSFGSSIIGNPKITKHLILPKGYENRIIKIDSKFKISIDEEAEYKNKSIINKIFSRKPRG